MKPLKNLVNPAHLVIILVMFACSDADPDAIGTLSITSTHDCDIRVFDSHGRQLDRQHYEVGKAPAVVTMKSTGIFIVHAVSGNTTIKEPITYAGGNLNYYIEFP
jgi:hypothetical protein